MAQGKARFNSLGIAAAVCVGNSYAANADETVALQHLRNLRLYQPYMLY